MESHHSIALCNIRFAIGGVLLLAHGTKTKAFLITALLRQGRRKPQTTARVTAHAISPVPFLRLVDRKIMWHERFQFLSCGVSSVTFHIKWRLTKVSRPMPFGTIRFQGGDKSYLFNQPKIGLPRHD